MKKLDSRNLFSQKLLNVAKNNSLHLPCYPIVVRLPDTTYTADSSLDQEVLSEIWHTFLGDHEVWFDSDHFIADLFDVFLLHLQNLAAKLQLTLYKHFTNSLNGNILLLSSKSCSINIFSVQFEKKNK